MSSADVSQAAVAAHRSYLFAPGSDLAMMRKALAAGADAVVLDLEDAVASDMKDAARAAVSAVLAEHHASSAAAGSDCPAIHVRINRAGDGYDVRDLDVAVHPAVEALRLPKTEDPHAVRTVAAAVADQERAQGIPLGRLRLYPTIESARGVLQAQAIASCDARVVRLVVGRADLLADLGARGDDALTMLVPCALIALASRSVGIGAPVDGATTDLLDVEVLRSALVRARALGFHGKSAIHPRQLDAIHEAFTPDDLEFAQAERIIAAANAADGGATALDGELVDVAVVRRAQGLLSLRRRG